MNKAAIWCIRAYQAVWSGTPPTCRFHPTCSAYAAEAFQEHSFFCAFRLAVRRVSRCHPLSPQAADPVPERGCPPCGCRVH